MRQAVRWRTAAFALSVLFAAPLAASRVVFVPWKVLPRGVAAPVNGALVLYWIPASPEEMRRSDMITSTALAMLSSRCVAMYVVRADDEERIRALGVSELPAAVLTDAGGAVVRVEKHNGPLRAVDVESVLRDEVARRETAAESLLEAGRRHAAAGRWSEAAAAYQDVAAQRCAFPRLARSAQRALGRIRPERLSSVRDAGEHP